MYMNTNDGMKMDNHDGNLFRLMQSAQVHYSIYGPVKLAAAGDRTICSQRHV